MLEEKSSETVKDFIQKVIENCESQAEFKKRHLQQLKDVFANSGDNAQQLSVEQLSKLNDLSCYFLQKCTISKIDFSLTNNIMDVLAMILHYIMAQSGRIAKLIEEKQINSEQLEKMIKEIQSQLVCLLDPAGSSFNNLNKVRENLKNSQQFEDMGFIMRANSQKQAFMKKDSSIFAKLLQIKDQNTLYATFFAKMVNRGLITLEQELFKPLLDLSETLLKHRIASDEASVLGWISTFLKLSPIKGRLLESIFNCIGNIPENSLIALTETITQTPLEKAEDLDRFLEIIVKVGGNAQNENLSNLNRLLEIFSNFVKFYYNEGIPANKGVATLLNLNKLLGYALGFTEKKVASGQEELKIDVQQTQQSDLATKGALSMKSPESITSESLGLNDDLSEGLPIDLQGTSSKLSEPTLKKFEGSERIPEKKSVDFGIKVDTIDRIQRILDSYFSLWQTLFDKPTVDSTINFATIASLLEIVWNTSINTKHSNLKKVMAEFSLRFTNLVLGSSILQSNIEFTSSLIKYVQQLLLSVFSNLRLKEQFIFIFQSLAIIGDSLKVKHADLIADFARSLIKKLSEQDFADRNKLYLHLTLHQLFKLIPSSHKPELFSIFLTKIAQEFQNSTAFNLVEIAYQTLVFAEDAIAPIDLTIFEIINNKSDIDLATCTDHTLLAKNFVISKSVLRTVTLPSWFTDENKEKLVQLTNVLNQKQSSFNQASDQLIAMIFHFNLICKNFSSSFQPHSLVAQVDKFKGNFSSNNFFKLIGCLQSDLTNISDSQSTEVQRTHFTEQIASLFRINYLLKTHLESGKAKGGEEEKADEKMQSEEETKLLSESILKVLKNIKDAQQITKVNHQKEAQILLTANKFQPVPVVQEFVRSLLELTSICGFPGLKKFTKNLEGVTEEYSSTKTWYHHLKDTKLQDFAQLNKNKDLMTLMIKCHAIAMNPFMNAETFKLPAELREVRASTNLASLLCMELIKLFSYLVNIYQVHYKTSVAVESLNEFLCLSQQYCIMDPKLHEHLTKDALVELFFKASESTAIKLRFAGFLTKFKEVCMESAAVKLATDVLYAKDVDRNLQKIVYSTVKSLITHIHKGHLKDPLVKLGFVSLFSIIGDSINYFDTDHLNELLTNIYSSSFGNLSVSLLNNFISVIFCPNRYYPSIKKAFTKHQFAEREKFKNYFQEKTLGSLFEFILQFFAEDSFPEDIIGGEGGLEESKDKDLEDEDDEKVGLLTEELLGGGRKAGLKSSKGKAKKKYIGGIEKDAPKTKKSKQPNKSKSDLEIITEESKGGDPLKKYSDIRKRMIRQFYSEFYKLASDATFEAFVIERIIYPPYSWSEILDLYSGLMEADKLIKKEETFTITSRLQVQRFFSFIGELVVQFKNYQDKQALPEEAFLKGLLTLTTMLVKQLFESILETMQQQTDTQVVELKYLTMTFDSIALLMKEISKHLFKDLKNALEHDDQIIFVCLRFLDSASEVRPTNPKMQAIFDNLTLSIFDFITKLVKNFDSKDQASARPQRFELEVLDQPKEEPLVCTYNITGDRHTNQHWYHCYTCGLVDHTGACSVCAKACHMGHDVSYAGQSNFFCDCAVGSGTQPCKIYKPAQPKASGGLFSAGDGLKLMKKMAGDRPDLGLKSRKETEQRDLFKFQAPEGGPGGAGGLFGSAKAHNPFEDANEERSSLLYEGEEEKLEGYSSDSEKDELSGSEDLNFLHENLKIRAGSLFPHKFLSSKLKGLSLGKLNLSLQSKLAASYISPADFSKDRGLESSSKIEQEASDEDSVSLGHIQDYIEERSLMSNMSFAVSPVRAFGSNADERGLKQKLESGFSPEGRFNEIFQEFAEKKVNKKFNYSGCILQIIQSVLENYIQKMQGQTMVEESTEAVAEKGSEFVDFSLIMDTTVAQSLEPMAGGPTRILMAGFEIRIRPEHLGNSDRGIISLLHSTNPPFKKQIDYNGKNFIAVCEADRISIYDKKTIFASLTSGEKKSSNLVLKGQAGKVEEIATKIDKTRCLSRIAMREVILSIAFNREASDLLAVAGISSCFVLNLDANGKATSNLRQINFDAESEFIIRMQWLPKSKTHLMIGTLRMIKVFDITQDCQNPVLFLLTLDAYLRDFNVSLGPGSQSEYRVVVTSADGQIFQHTFDLNLCTVATCEELYMVETITLPADKKPRHNKAAIAMHTSPLSKLTFFSFDDGVMLMGAINDKDGELINAQRLNLFENKEKAAAFANLPKYGNVFSHYEDIAVNEERYLACAMLRKTPGTSPFQPGGIGVPVLIETKKNSITYTPFMNTPSIRSDGFTVLDHATSGEKQHYILSLLEDGNLQLNAVGAAAAGQDIEVKTGESEIVKQFAEIREIWNSSGQPDEKSETRKLIEAELLEPRKKPKFILDFPEKGVKLESNIIQFQKDLSAFNGKTNLDPVTYNFQFKAKFTCNIKIKNPEYLIYGLHIRISSRAPLKLNLYNREWMIKEREGFFDIALTPQEAAYTSLLGELEFTIGYNANLIKKMPFGILVVSTYGNKIENFEQDYKPDFIRPLYEKLRATKKTGKKADDAYEGFSLDFLTENKDESLGMNIKQTALNLVSMLQFTKLDITQNDPKTIEELISKLKLIVAETKDNSVSRACRMLIKSLLGVQIDIQGIPREDVILGHELNYYTSKDFTMIKNIYQRLHGSSPLSLDELADIIRYVNKVQAKRPAQILKIFAEYPGILTSVVEQLIPHFKEGDQGGSETSAKINSFITNEFSSLVDLIVLYYRYSKNTTLARMYPDVEKLSVDDPKLEQVPNDKTSLEVLKLLFDIVINADKSLKMKLLKSLVKTFYVEFYSYLKDKEAKEPLEIQYYGEIYPPKPEEEKMQAVKEAAGQINLDDMDIEDEQLMEMAIQMSMQDKDQIIPENRQQQQQEETKQAIKGPKTYHFYPFDIAADLMKFLIDKIKAVNTNVENAGILYNCVYKILKMQQLIASNHQKTLDTKWIDMVADLIYDQIASVDSKQLIKFDHQAKKMVCWLSLINVCLRSKEAKRDPTKTDGKTSAMPKEKISKQLTEKDKSAELLRPSATLPAEQRYNLGSEFGKNLAKSLQGVENQRMNMLSSWIYSALEALFENFKAGNGSLYYSSNDMLAECSTRKLGQVVKYGRAEIEALSKTWSPIFKKSEVQKKNGNLFTEIDQDLMSNLLIFSSNLISFNFQLVDIGKWPDLLSRIMLIPPTSLIAPKFTKLLLKVAVAGKPELYTKVKDTVTCELEIDRILQIYKKTNQFKRLLSYEQTVSLARALQKLEKVASVRPTHWQEQCKANLQVLEILHQVFTFDVEECKEISIRLIARFYSDLKLDSEMKVLDTMLKEKKPEYILKVTAMADESQPSNWLSTTSSSLDFFINKLLYDKSTANVSLGLVELIIGLWNTGNQSQKLHLLRTVHHKISDLLKFGSNSEYLLALLGYFSYNTEWNSDESLMKLKHEITEIIVKCYGSITNAIKNHPNHQTYSALQQYLQDNKPKDFKYYFEAESFLDTSDVSEMPFQELRINNIQSEMKFTHNAVVVRLNNTYAIKEFLIALQELRSSRQVNTINIYISNKTVNELNEIKNNLDAWKKIYSLNLDKKRGKEGGKGKMQIKFKLPLQVIAKNLLIEFNVGDPNKAFIGELMQDPMLECKKCGFYPDNNKDNIICPGCGHSKYFNREIAINARLGFATEPIDSEKAKTLCEKELQKAMDQLSSCLQKMRLSKFRVEEILSSLEGSSFYVSAFESKQPPFISSNNPVLMELHAAYQKDAKENYDKLLKTVSTIKSLRKALQEYVLTTENIQLDEHSQDTLKVETANYSQYQGVYKAYLAFLSHDINISPFISEIISQHENFIHELITDVYNSDCSRTLKSAVVHILSVILSTEKGESFYQKYYSMLVDKALEQAKIVNTQIKKTMNPLLVIVSLVGSFEKQLSELKIESPEDKNNKAYLQAIGDIHKILNEALVHNSGFVNDNIICIVLDLIRQYVPAEEPSLDVSKLKEKLKEKTKDKDSELLMMIESVEMQTKAEEESKTELSMKFLSHFLPLKKVQSKKPGDFDIAVNTAEITEDHWWIKCMLNFSERVNYLACKHFKRLIHEDDFKDLFAKLLKAYKALPQTTQNAQNFFRALNHIFLRDFSAEKNEKLAPFFLDMCLNLFEIAKQDLEQLFKTYESHLDGTSYLYLVDFAAGYTAKEALEIMNTIIQGQETIKSDLKLNKSYVKNALNAFLIARKFSLIKNNNLHEVDNKLSSLMENLKPDHEADKRAFISECVAVLPRYPKDAVTQAFLYEQILEIVAPERKKPDFQVNLTKALSLEEFIPGHIRSSFLASDLGETMREVRSRICRELDIADPDTIELLVANQIIEVDLPIYLVYEKVWIPFVRQREEESQQPPSETIPNMVVIFRIQGLEGEATENRVSNLVDDFEDEKEQERRTRLTDVMAEDLTIPGRDEKKTGIEIVLDSVSRIKSSTIGSKNRQLLKMIIKLLKFASRIDANRALIIEHGGVKILLELLLQNFHSYDEDEKDSIVENLLYLLGNLLKESPQAQVEEDEIRMDIEDPAGKEDVAMDNLNICLKKIAKSAETGTSSKLISALTKILPYLTNDKEAVCRKLVETVKDYITFEKISDEKKRKERDFYMARVIEMLETLPPYYTTFRAILYQERIAEKVIKFHQSIIPDPTKLDEKVLEANREQLINSINIALGLVNGSPKTQAVFLRNGTLELIYRLSDVSVKTKDLGKTAEAFVEYFLCGKNIEYLDDDAFDFLKELRDNEIAEKKRIAMEARERIMNKLGLKMPKSKRALEEEKMDEELKIEKSERSKISLQEERCLGCVSCQEGYGIRADDLTGVYIYTKKTKIPSEDGLGQGKMMLGVNNGIATVTHFNAIHLACHMAGVKADKNMKKPRAEWDGAQIRNSHTKCNGWFPIRGPKISDSDYETGLSKFYQSIEPFLKSEKDRVWIHINDLAHLFTKFAKRETFSKETKGGAAEHNMKLVPFYIQFIQFLMLKTRPEKIDYYNKILANFALDYEKIPSDKSKSTLDEFFILLTLVLVLCDGEAWTKKYKKAFIYYILSVGSTLISSKELLEVTTHNMQSKLMLSPMIEGKSGEVSVFHLDSDKKPEEDTKIEKLLDKIQPMIILLRLADLMIERIHNQVSMPSTQEFSQKTFLIELNSYISKKYDKVIFDCEELNRIYHKDILQTTNFESFLKALGCYEGIITEFKDLASFIKQFI